MKSYGWLGRNNGYGWMYPNDIGGGEAPELPDQGNIIFQWDLHDGDTTPQVGSATYTRSGTMAVPTSQYGWTKFTANNIPMGVVRNEGTEQLSGAQFGGSVRNYCLQSEDFTTTWTTVGTGSVTANTADGPFGATSDADTISGSATGDGVTQTISLTAASRVFSASVFLKATSGSPKVKIVLKDGGTEGTFTEVELSSNWQRFEVAKAFTSAASGNVIFQILVGNTSTVRAIGAQVEGFFSGSGGRRLRHAGANWYVPTTTTGQTAGNGNAAVANSVATQLTTQGSFSAWIMNPLDPKLDIMQESQYVISLSAEEFAVTIDQETGPSLWINSSNVCTGASSAGVDNLPVNEWAHLVVTWDTVANEHNIYLNGELWASSTTAASAWTAGSADIHLGISDPYLSYISLDGPMSEIVFWSSVLDASEANDAYQVKRSIGRRPDPGTGKIFSVTLSDSPIPTVGDKHYRYNDRGTPGWMYEDSTTSLADTDITTFPVRYPLNGYNKGGWGPNAGTTSNICLQSEDLTTTWTKINGAETITANASTALDGTTTADALAGTAAGHGVEQSVGLAAASNQAVFAVYMKRVSGSGTPQLRLEDNTGSEGTTVTMTPGVSNGVWDRYHCYHSFSGSASGNMKAQILCNDSTGSVYHFWGAQVEQTAKVGGSVLYAKRCSAYLPTTTTATTSGKPNVLIYRAVDSINILKGTVIAWAFSNVENSTDFIVPNGPTILGAPGQNDNFYLHFLSGNMDLDYGLINGTGSGFTNTRFQWKHYAFVWDATGATTTLTTYVDGVQFYTNSASTAERMYPRKLIVGVDHLHSAVDIWDGGIDTLDIYGEAKDTAFVLADFNATKAGYGR